MSVKRLQMVSNGEDLPSLKKDLQNAKCFLRQCCGSSEDSDSLFAHLSAVILIVMDENRRKVFKLSDLSNFENFNENRSLDGFVFVK